MPVRVVTPPAEEPVSLPAAKLHLRVDGDAEDALIGALIVAARQHVEAYCARALVTQTLRLTADAFPPAGRVLRLPRSPAAEVAGVEFVGADGVPRTWDPGLYQVDTTSEPARLLPAPGTGWPATRRQMEAVTVTYRAGQPAATVPRAITTAMLLLVGHWYANREAVSVGGTVTEQPLTVEMLLAPYRVWSLA